MLGSDMLEVGIGLVLLFLFMSLICTAVREAIEGILKSRAKDLEQGIRELLNDKDGTGLTKAVFDHPFLYSLFNGEYKPGKLSKNPFRSPRMGLIAGRKLPSYIPASLFAQALLDVVARGELPKSTAAAADPARPEAAADPARREAAADPARREAAADPKTKPADARAGDPKGALLIRDLRDSVAKIENIKVERAILSAIDMAQGDLDKAKTNIENWYNGTMDRVSGWYKRRTQTILLLIGLGAAIILNIDVITIAGRLNDDKALRQAAVAQAGAIVRGQGTASRQDSPNLKQSDPKQPDPKQSSSNPDPCAEQNAGTGQNSADANRLAALQCRTYSQLRDNLKQIGYPIGWTFVPNTPRPNSVPEWLWNLLPEWLRNSRPDPQACAPATTQGQQRGQTQKTCAEWGQINWLPMILGWLITALAIMLGAPFWFDVLNKLMVIRSTVKPHEKSPEEASEDRQVRRGRDLKIEVVGQTKP